MTPQEAAAALDGVEYVHPLEAKLKALRPELRGAGLVVCYGASDDLLEFDGSFYDEVGAWEGVTVHVDSLGLITSECSEGKDCPYFKKTLEKAATITAIWGPKDIEGDPSWLVKTAIPHEQFKIMEDGAVFGIGIVFRAIDVKPEN